MPLRFRQLSRRALIIGIIAAIISIAAFALTPTTFLRAYLTAYLLWLAVPLGSAAVLMTHHLATGRWGKALRPALESAVATTPLLPLLFLPILVGARWLYPWADPAQVAADPILQHERPYLNLPFFIIRAIIYFAAWLIGAALLARWSARRDPASAVPQHKLQTLSAVGLVIYAVTITFAAYDWLASLQPRWFSSVFGLYLLISQAMTGFALLVILVTAVSRRATPAFGPNALPPSTLHDFGNLLLMLVVLHTYLSFAQFFIIWNGNVPAEASWYVARTRGGWGPVATLIIITDFALPFGALLFRFVKRTPATLVAVACIILAARVIEAPWIVLPSFGPIRLIPILIALAAAIALGGFWFALFLRNWSRTPLILEVPEHA